jgi:carboxymethylenebutenolidase
MTITTTTTIATPDGPCTTDVVRLPGSGAWPAVIVFFDAAGRRPSMVRIAERIATMGYVVVVPDLFHRAPPVTAALGATPSLAALQKVFQDPEKKSSFMATYYRPAIDYANLETTIGAVLAYLATRPDVAGKVGTTGYCMGGNASVRAATIFGDRIGASAAFHPGGLVTDQPDSPHLRVKSTQARLYFGPSIGDLPAEAEVKLRAELDAGNVRYAIEQYDAKHGYAVEDAPTYDPEAADRTYAVLERLYAESLVG